MKKVTIVGAGNVGATAAQLILQKDIADVCLIDVVEGLPQGKALDMMHMKSIEKFSSNITGTNEYLDTANSDIVVITAGVARKPGMTREDLIGINSKIMADVIDKAQAQSPNAIFIVVTNPLDVMTEFAYKKSGLDSSKIFGMGGVLDSARFAYEISQLTGAEVAKINAIVCGAHGQGMVCLPSQSTVDGKCILDILSDDEIATICANTVNGGAQIVEFLKTGSAFFAPGASIARMVEAIITDSKDVLSVCARCDGQYGVKDTYMCVPVKLGVAGIKEIVEFNVSDAELKALQESALSIQTQLANLNV
ncbi:MAG: malate dehydrogenase [Coriobacteriales bacterium]|nr:malate dehydrogenase [Coriobacteriales bacterium]